MYEGGKCRFVETWLENLACMGYIMHWRWWLATAQDIRPAILSSPQKLLDHYLTIRAFSSSKTTQNNGKNQKTVNLALSLQTTDNQKIKMAAAAGVEPATCSLGESRSIQLSYATTSESSQ